MKRLIGIVSLAMLLVASPHIALAQPAVSKSEAASIATGQYPGKVINVSLSDDGKQPVYRVKVLDKKGGMHIVTINGNTGQIISAH